MALPDPKRILVTGASAFPGRELAAALTERGWDVRTPTREELDLADDEAVRKWLHGRPVAAVVHAAAAPPRRDPRLEETPIDRHLHMFLNLSRNRDCFGRMIVLGSGDEYGPRTVRPRVKEIDFGKKIPVEDSAFAKFSVSRLVEQFGERFVALRMFGLYGPDEEGATRPSFVQEAVRAAVARETVEVASDRHVDFLPVPDLAAVVDHFLRHPARHRAYNVTPDRSPSLSLIARLATEAAGSPVPPRIAPQHGPDFTGDNSRLRAELPNLRFTPIEEGIARVVERITSGADSSSRRIST